MEIKKKEVITSINIEGEEYFSLRDFAYLVNRSEANVRHLFNKGNKLRKLRVAYFGKTAFIPAKELLEFPFLLRGKNPFNINGIVEKYRLENGELQKTEEVYDK